MRENKKQLYAYRSFWPELKTRKRFKDEVGVTVHNVMISNTATVSMILIPLTNSLMT